MKGQNTQSHFICIVLLKEQFKPPFFLPHLLFVNSRVSLSIMSFFVLFFYLENDPVLTVLFPRFSFYISQLLLIGFLPSVCASHFKKTLEYILNFFCFISFTETGIFWHFLNTISCKDVRLDQWYTSWKGFSGLNFKEVFGDTINLLLAFLFFFLIYW